MTLDWHHVGGVRGLHACRVGITSLQSRCRFLVELELLPCFMESLLVESELLVCGIGFAKVMTLAVKQACSLEVSMLRCYQVSIC